MKVRASLKPESSERKRTIGSVMRELVWAEHQVPDLPDADALPETATSFVRAIDVPVFAGFAATLGLLVEHDGTACLRDEKMDELSEAAEDELNPEYPAPVEVGLNEASDNRRDDRARA